MEENLPDDCLTDAELSEIIRVDKKRSKKVHKISP
jgi:hypothetical protein|tara:strand:- start:582 stop:686 length:105 start_codon:yes stop_codon:yes gene_type:complete